jgi:hypothetical protein
MIELLQKVLAEGGPHQISGDIPALLPVIQSYNASLTASLGWWSALRIDAMMCGSSEGNGMAFACQYPQTREKCTAVYGHENRRVMTAPMLQIFGALYW